MNFKNFSDLIGGRLNFQKNQALNVWGLLLVFDMVSNGFHTWSCRPRCYSRERSGWEDTGFIIYIHKQNRWPQFRENKLFYSAGERKWKFPYFLFLICLFFQLPKFFSNVIDKHPYYRLCGWCIYPWINQKEENIVLGPTTQKQLFLCHFYIFLLSFCVMPRFLTWYLHNCNHTIFYDLLPSLNITAELFYIANYVSIIFHCCSEWNT